jgi:tRNA dimethylallyltransferase
MTHVSPRRALLIAGPTASGKSELALELADRRGAVIINADALQVYRDLRILTSRPSPEDERRHPHRLYGYVSGTEPFSVGRWLEDVSREIRHAWAEDRLPIVVGGTGLYFKALEQGLADVPEIPNEIREKWRSFKGDAIHELSRRDPAAAASLKPRDRQRLIRELEVLDATGQPLRHWQREAQCRSILADVVAEKLFLDIPRQILYDRAEKRFDRMLEEGAIDEVRPLVGLDPELPMMRAIGVSEIRDYLMGRQQLAAAAQAAKTATRHYIKRQLTWWRNQMSGWVPVTPP